MKLVYFAWVRERVGKTDENIEVPEGIATVADLVRWLKGRGEEYDYAFENEGIVRAAIDHVHVKPEASIAGAREIVLVLAASAHRAAAFEAASFMMDYLKTQAPFWKREHLKDGTTGAWVEAKEADDRAMERWA